MGYRLAEQAGDTQAVPQIIFTHLCHADGDDVRVALYLLQTGITDPRTIAHDLGLKSADIAKHALQYWAGAGLLVQQRAAVELAPPPEQKASRVQFSDLNDPHISLLCGESQMALGRGLSRGEMQRIVSLYENDGWDPEVILLACTEVARLGHQTVGAVSRELTRWKAAGVETGKDAEKHLQVLAQRQIWCEEVAKLFGIADTDLTRWERSAIARWHEDWGCGNDMIEEALLHAENHRTVRYVDGILRSWRAQGITTVTAARGQGQLSGSNILATGQKPAATPKKDLFSRNWNAVFDDDMEG